MPVAIPIGIALNAAYTFLLASEYPFLPYVVGPFVLLSIIGMALLMLDKRRAGAWMVIVGAVPFVPLGLVAIVGARNVFDQLTREKFQEGELPYARAR